MKKWQVGLAAAAAVVGAMAGLSAAWPPINDVSTGATPEYPDLQPRAYSLPKSRVFEAAVATARAMPGWTITSVDPDAGVIQAVSHVRWTPFRDDVTLHITPEGDRVLVNMRSHSRVGRGDLGVNARRIRGYLRALDARLKAERG